MKTDNIWAPICGHAIYNAMSASVLPIEAVVNMGKTGAIMYTLLTVVCCSLFTDKNSIDFSVSFYNYHEPSIYPCLSGFDGFFPLAGLPWNCTQSLIFLLANVV